jgi:hypothetical protein
MQRLLQVTHKVDDETERQLALFQRLGLIEHDRAEMFQRRDRVALRRRVMSA